MVSAWFRLREDACVKIERGGREGKGLMEKLSAVEVYENAKVIVIQLKKEERSCEKGEDFSDFKETWRRKGGEQDYHQKGKRHLRVNGEEALEHTRGRRENTEVFKENRRKLAKTG